MPGSSERGPAHLINRHTHVYTQQQVPKILVSRYKLDWNKNAWRELMYSESYGTS